MLTLSQDIVVLIGTLTVAFLFITVLDRTWPVETRRIQNDLIGWQLTVLGTTYAVILGFMFYTAWTSFSAAELNVDLEASALRNLFRLAEGLPPSQRAVLEAQARAYASAVVEKDWPAMDRGELPVESHEINRQMWRTLMAVKTTSLSENTAEDHALSELGELTLHRRTRLLESATGFPTIFWIVLFVGGVLTLISASMFGAANFKLHALQVLSLTLLLTLAVLAISDVNAPFQGWVHVSSFPFERAELNMEAE
jgi:Protein of unknown function (DUF4239)